MRFMAHPTVHVPQGRANAEEKNPASHFSATFAVFTKKGTSAESRNPFRYCDGAEGGI